MIESIVILVVKAAIHESPLISKKKDKHLIWSSNIHKWIEFNKISLNRSIGSMSEAFYVQSESFSLINIKRIFF